MIPLLTIAREWQCTHCHTTASTRRSEPHTEFHHCPGVGGFNMPMVQVDVRSRTRIVEREDYIRGEDVQLTDDGRPIMAVVTEYQDGHSDCAVYAPTAHGGVE